ncbi:hypothetical protein LTR37_011536 [Vermiconidia calcicola]|uniref:Uncharacterized protein n=1 Tax=Vermiconidia calcicola TaxID=1690605 RepID=A0ACC3N3L7_9PEZI|nr:hypothetical protein LTR37_011536 [Vermiconidia calcicola]
MGVHGLLMSSAMASLTSLARTNRLVIYCLGIVADRGVSKGDGNTSGSEGGYRFNPPPLSQGFALWNLANGEFMRYLLTTLQLQVA